MRIPMAFVLIVGAAPILGGCVSSSVVKTTTEIERRFECPLLVAPFNPPADNVTASGTTGGYAAAGYVMMNWDYGFDANDIVKLRESLLVRYQTSAAFTSVIDAAKNPRPTGNLLELEVRFAKVGIGRRENTTFFGGIYKVILEGTVSLKDEDGRVLSTREFSQQTTSDSAPTISALKALAAKEFLATVDEVMLATP